MAKLLLATHHGIFAVDDAGIATRVAPVQDYMGFSPSPSDPLTYYASGHPAGGGNLGFLASKDGGATWTQVSEGHNGPVDFHQMDVSAADPKTIYGVYGRVQTSKDGGATWTATGKPPGGLIAIAASSQSPSRVYAATKSGLFVSEDAGATWALVQFEGEPVSLVKAAGGKLYAFVVGRGLLVGEEKAPATWTPLSNDFGESIPLYLAMGREAMYIATHDSSVLASGDGGHTWKAFGVK